MLRFRSLDSVIARVLGTALVLGTLSYAHQNQHSTNEFTRKRAAPEQVAALVPNRPPADLYLTADEAVLVFKESLPLRMRMVGIGDAATNEGDGGVNIPVTVTPPSQTPVMVNIGAVNGTAQQGIDFLLGQNTITLPGGTTTTTIPVQIVNDTLPEPTETFTI